MSFIDTPWVPHPSFAVFCERGWEAGISTCQRFFVPTIQMKTENKKKPGALTLTLPATSANLGPAFDAAALAFDLNFQITAKPAKKYLIRASGRDTAICIQLENNLILKTYEDILQSHDKAVFPLSIRIQNKMPIGKGCGSSAAARLAGIAFAVHFGRLGWRDAEIVAEASRLEHHPDNAAACWLGGIAVARMTQDEVQAVKITPKGKWPLLLAIPEEKLSRRLDYRAIGLRPPRSLTERTAC